MTTRCSVEVFCRFTFVGFHRWPDAPDECAWLRDRHRHEFHVVAYVEVDRGRSDDGDRVVEFCLLKQRMLDAVAEQRANRLVETWSCEQWASWLLDRFGLARCEVSEDGENGAVVTRV